MCAHDVLGGVLVAFGEVVAHGHDVDHLGALERGDRGIDVAGHREIQQDQGTPAASAHRRLSGLLAR